MAFFKVELKLSSYMKNSLSSRVEVGFAENWPLASLIPEELVVIELLT